MFDKPGPRTALGAGTDGECEQKDAVGIGDDIIFPFCPLPHKLVPIQSESRSNVNAA